MAAIHSNSSSIIQSVKQTGTIGREIKDLEEQVYLFIYFLCSEINYSSFTYQIKFAIPKIKYWDRTFIFMLIYVISLSVIN